MATVTGGIWLRRGDRHMRGVRCSDMAIISLQYLYELFVNPEVSIVDALVYEVSGVDVAATLMDCEVPMQGE